jgi:hypothetical protein
MQTSNSQMNSIRRRRKNFCQMGQASRVPFAGSKGARMPSRSLESEGCVMGNASCTAGEQRRAGYANQLLGPDVMGHWLHAAAFVRRRVRIQQYESHTCGDGTTVDPGMDRTALDDDVAGMKVSHRTVVELKR